MKTLLAALLLVFGAWLPAYGQDFDFRNAEVYGSPAEIRDWPIGVTIKQITLNPDRDFGMSINFEPRNSWPDIIPSTGGPNNGPWEGPIQYTVWACMQVPNWGCAGFIQMWRDRASTGAPFMVKTPDGRSNWKANWAYDSRWGKLGDKNVDVVPGSRMCFLVVAGNTRAGWAVETAVRQRSDVACLTIPADGRGTFDFTGSTTPTTPTVPPVVTPPTTPPTVPTADFEQLQRTVIELAGKVQALEGQVNSQHDTLVQQSEAVNTFGNRLTVLESHPIVDGCSASFYGARVGCTIKFRVP